MSYVASTSLSSCGANLIGVGGMSSVPRAFFISDRNLGPHNSFALIGPLQDNGGPTWTYALLPGSDPIDGGDPVNGCLGPTGVLATDQRGVVRPLSAACDIGAFEFMPPSVWLPAIAR